MMSLSSNQRIYTPFPRLDTEASVKETIDLLPRAVPKDNSLYESGVKETRARVLSYSARDPGPTPRVWPERHSLAHET